MAHEIFMPKLSSTMDTGTITQWMKNEGDSVKVGDVIFEVMTDKIAIEVEAYESGVLLKRYYEADEAAPVGSIIGYIGTAGEQVPAAPSEAPLTETAPATSAPLPPPNEPTSALSSEPSKINDIRATPAARKLAYEKSIPLTSITGSGKNGRIHVEDIQNFTPHTSSTQTQETSTFTPWTGMRKAIAEQMVKSKHTAPHVTMHTDVDITAVISLRERLLPLIEAQTGKRLSFTEIVILALAKSLKLHPLLNAHVTGDGIYHYANVNIGVAVALSDGLIIPVIKNADTLGLSALTEQVKASAEKARDNKLLPDDTAGATFTISALGKSSVHYFTPVINVPEAAILGVGGIYEELKLIDGTPQMVKMLPLSLSFDHRAVDGAPAAAFLDTLKSLLENPTNLLI